MGKFSIWRNYYVRLVTNFFSVALTLFCFIYIFVVISMGNTFIAETTFVETLSEQMVYDLAADGRIGPAVEAGIEGLTNELAQAERVLGGLIIVWIAVLGLTMFHALLLLNTQRILNGGQFCISAYWVIGIALLYIYSIQTIWSEGLVAGILQIIGLLILISILPVIYAVKHFLLNRDTILGNRGQWYFLSCTLPIIGSIVVLNKFKKDINMLVLPIEYEEINETNTDYEIEDLSQFDDNAV